MREVQGHRTSNSHRAAAKGNTGLGCSKKNSDKKEDAIDGMCALSHW